MLSSQPEVSLIHDFNLGQQLQPQVVRKRKKTSRACIHCQKAHVTCDAGRPCQRCIRKGCQDTCQDGVRKKAKYLEDDGPSRTVNKASLPLLSQSLPLTPPEALAAAQGEPQYPTELSPYDFGSRATNLEYSILSTMLRTNMDPPQQLALSGMSASGSPDSEASLPYFADVQISAARGAQHHGAHFAQQDEEAFSPEVYLSDGMPHQFSTPEQVYQLVTTPFPYTQGFHGLIAYLKSRFDRTQLMHMARAMAAYRPSFIATTKLLKEADLIFMEQCFQRTLMEFQKIISASGTPTVVWRRTGQIAAVGKEFCILTGWTPDRLVSNTTFVVELMDDKSVVDYFDVFSKLAFGDSRGVTMTECTLLKPTGERIPTACTWTVKRDVFDIPMMIIGNFLPIF